MGKRAKHKTQIKKKTLNPEFNEVRLPTHHLGLLFMVMPWFSERNKFLLECWESHPKRYAVEQPEFPIGEGVSFLSLEGIKSEMKAHRGGHWLETAVLELNRPRCLGQLRV